MRRKTHEEVINDFKKVHGNKYDYSKVKYVNTRTKVIITCKVHGDFLQVPSSHKAGNGCAKCYTTCNKKTKKEINRQIKNRNIRIVGKYVNTHTNSKLKCYVCGNKWTATANSILRGSGCQKCYFDSQRTSKAELNKKLKLKKIKLVGKYTNSNTRVKFKCKICNNYWKTRLSTITSGNCGCPTCASYTSDYNVIYIWEAIGEKWNDKPIFKIGVTSKKLGNDRLKYVSNKFNFEYKVHLYLETTKALKIERGLLCKFKDKPLMESCSGFSEFRAVSRSEMNKEIKNILDTYNIKLH